MQLDIEILSGQRKGTTLHVLLYSGEKLEQICEDESVKISICSDKLYQNVYLGLHDIELEFVSCEKIGNMWKYTWEPQRTNGYYHAFFINYFGVFELYIKAISDDYENLSEYQIEVLAKKMTASSIDAMLSYIAQHDSNLIHTFLGPLNLAQVVKKEPIPPYID